MVKLLFLTILTNYLTSDQHKSGVGFPHENYLQKGSSKMKTKIAIILLNTAVQILTLVSSSKH